MSRKLKFPYYNINLTITNDKIKYITMNNNFNKHHVIKLEFFQPGDDAIVIMCTKKLT